TARWSPSRGCAGHTGSSARRARGSRSSSGGARCVNGSWSVCSRSGIASSTRNHLAQSRKTTASSSPAHSRDHVAEIRETTASTAGARDHFTETRQTTAHSWQTSAHSSSADARHHLGEA
ncbi:hypothetical protein F442_05968, partial [Phytophthora nicotianae P10297]